MSSFSYLKIANISAESEETPSGTIELQRPISNIPQGGTSLVDITCRLVLATQRGRACTQDGKALYDKWTLSGPPQDLTLEFGDGYLAWKAAFENNPFHGVRLIMVPKTVRPPPNRYIFCVYGCQKNDSLRWFSSHP